MVGGARNGDDAMPAEHLVDVQGKSLERKIVARVPDRTGRLSLHRLSQNRHRVVMRATKNTGRSIIKK